MPNTTPWTASKPVLTTPATAAYTQLESEINLVCLAHWQHEGNHVIVSRTMSNEILCSIWAASDSGKLLQLLEIDSNCNYNAKKMANANPKINYGFMLVSECNPRPNDASFESSASASLSDQPTPDSSSSLAIGVDTRQDEIKPPSLIAGVPSTAVVRSPSHLFVLLALSHLLLVLIHHQ